MGLYEQIRDIAKTKGYSINRLEQELGFARSSINKFNKNAPSADKLQQIAGILGVTVDYLMMGNENKKTVIPPIDERDISKKIDEIIGDINDADESPLYFDGKMLDEKDKAILAHFLLSVRQQVEIMKENDRKK